MLNFSQASENNKKPILEKLASFLSEPVDVTEIGSGSGQHAIYFSRHLNYLVWQPTERLDGIDGLTENIQNYAPKNVLDPVILDVDNHPWPIDSSSCIYTANTLHIMSWESVRCFFKGVNEVLNNRGLLCIYGPFKYHCAFTTQSNAKFDQWLKQRDPESGIRDFEAIQEMAMLIGLTLIIDYAMPANNQFLVFKRSE